MAKGKNKAKKQNLKKIESVGGFDGDIKGNIHSKLKLKG